MVAVLYAATCTQTAFSCTAIMGWDCTSNLLAVCAWLDVRKVAFKGHLVLCLHMDEALGPKLHNGLHCMLMLIVLLTLSFILRRFLRQNIFCVQRAGDQLTPRPLKDIDGED